MFFKYFFLLFYSIGACAIFAQSPSQALLRTSLLQRNQRIDVLAFGSCNKVDKNQDIWYSVMAVKPNVWVWLGDIVYADTKDMKAMHKMYLQQKNKAPYSQLITQVPVIGVWDDHDYGSNDGDKFFEPKKESQQIMMDFLDIPVSDTLRRQEGAYQSYTLGPKGQQVKIILLDTRYHRDSLASNPAGPTRYMINETGDMLGDAQWQWLEKELTHSTAQVHIVGSSIQIIPDQQYFEKWANFPASRKRLLQLINSAKPANLVLLSGDRHLAEISRIDLPDYKNLFDFTSSGLTHTASISKEPNRFRVGPLLVQRNFGVLRIDWKNPKKPVVTAEVWGLNKKLLFKHVLTR